MTTIYFFFFFRPKQRERRADSRILSVEDHRQILAWLDKGTDAKLEVLYRASSDGWNAIDFHSRCDNKGPTVTVIKCNK